MGCAETVHLAVFNPPGETTFFSLRTAVNDPCGGGTSNALTFTV